MERPVAEKRGAHHGGQQRQLHHLVKFHALLGKMEKGREATGQAELAGGSNHGLQCLDGEGGVVTKQMVFKIHFTGEMEISQVCWVQTLKPQSVFGRLFSGVIQCFLS